MGEQLEYGDTQAPILRENIAEVYIALQPPHALPYVVAPREMEAQDIADFFAAHVNEVEELRAKMRKRFTSNKSTRCLYKTGDVAYVAGRPFMLQVNPLKTSKGLTKGSRGRATVKFGVDVNISLLTLYVVQTGDYDQTKTCFMSFARAVIMKNAPNILGACVQRIMPDSPIPAIRMRAMRGDMVKFQAGCLWLSEDIVPYPIDCLVAAIWGEMLPKATIDAAQAQDIYHEVLPGWEQAEKTLALRGKPYSNQ